MEGRLGIQGRADIIIVSTKTGSLEAKFPLLEEEFWRISVLSLEASIDWMRSTHKTSLYSKSIKNTLIASSTLVFDQTRGHPNPGQVTIQLTITLGNLQKITHAWVLSLDVLV